MCEHVEEIESKREDLIINRLLAELANVQHVEMCVCVGGVLKSPYDFK